MPLSASSSVTYGYDAIGQIGSASYDNGMCVAYGYDAAGNRTSQTNAAGAETTWGTGSYWGCLTWTAP
jgi:YD repeat-containing protein